MASVVTLPVPVSVDPDDPRARQVFLDTRVEGAPARPMLDTGSTRTTVGHRDAYEPRRLPATASVAGVHGVPQSRALVRLADLVWGGLTVRDLVVEVAPPGWPHPPVVGMDVLAGHTCDFRLAVGELDLDGPPRGEEPLELRSGPGRTPAVPVEWPGTTVDALWDTGAGITLVDRAWALAHPEIVTLTGETGTGTDLTGEVRSGAAGLLAPCRIGHVDFPAQDCGLVQGLPGGGVILGLPQLVRADWYFDFTAGRWSNRLPGD